MVPLGVAAPQQDFLVGGMSLETSTECLFLKGGVLCGHWPHAPLGEVRRGVSPRRGVGSWMVE